MNIWKNTKRGSVTLEAAIILPVFIIAAVTVSYCINLAVATESVTSAVCDEARPAAQRMYIVPVPAGIARNMENRVADDGVFVDRYDVTSVRFINDTVYLKSEFNVKNRMPVRLRDDFTISCDIKFRGFTGRENRGTLFTFDEMEKDDGSAIVWVFPAAGERYHKETCSYIEVCPRQMVLSSEIRRKYSPCRLCRPEDLSDGQFVYCFITSGRAFHTGECTTVDRYVVSMTRRQAAEEGYSPCSRCGGG